MEDAELRGRIAALEEIVRFLLNERTRDPAKRQQLPEAMSFMGGTTPEWISGGSRQDQEAAAHYRTALLHWPNRLGPDRPRSR